MSYQGKTGGIRGHGTGLKPVGLWQFNGNLNDSVGGNNLSLGTGTLIYGQILPGLVGLSLNGSTEIRGSTSPAALQLLGDMTMEMVAVCYASSNTLVNFSGVSETTADNTLYSLRAASASTFLGIESYHENGAGVDVTYDLADCFPLLIPFHIAQVRQGNQYSIFLNGIQIGATSSVLGAPTGGTAGILRVGGFNATQFFNGTIASLIIYNRALAPNEIASDYNLTLGSVFGRR